ncbi:UNVERIFIED_CONTAM: S-layer family protein [Acetivibrio alkalicellulosi]
MKVKIAFILTVVMIITGCISGLVYAEDNISLEDLIKTAKSVFEISDEYENFNYSVNTYSGKRMWNFNWSKKDSYKGMIEVSMDDKGNVINYYKYDDTHFDKGNKIPTITKSEALSKAEELIKKLNNDSIFDNLKLIEDNQIVRGDRAYFFTYIRTYDNIPLPLEFITVSVTSNTGEIQYYSKQWTSDIDFPSSENILNMDEAKKAFIENLGLRLVYEISKESDRAYLVYKTIYGSENVLDAFTGERINVMDLQFGKIGLASGGMGLENVKTSDSIMLSPEELRSVEEASKLISQEEAEDIIRKFDALYIDESFKLERAELGKGWYSDGTYTWTLYFTSDEGIEKGDFYYTMASINAETGEIISFNVYYPRSEDKTIKYDKESAKDIVENFLEQIQPDKFKETQYNELSYDRYFDYSKEDYSFSFERVANEIPIPRNSFRVTFDGITGRISNFSMEWNDVEFSPPTEILSLDEIYELFFKEVGINLEYQIINQFTISEDDSNQEARLVYAINSQKPAMFDAYTGTILNYNGEPYKEEKPLEYSDISEHYAKSQIETLAQIGVGLEGPLFKPNDKIKQKDYLLLVSQLIDSGYEFYRVTTLKSENEIDRLYSLLQREGIIREDEKDPDALLTREESIKFIIRALNYDKIADLHHIFNCTFNDKDEIDQNLIGYVVLARGLNIVNGYGDYFRPKDQLSRAEAIIIIYNSIKI